MAHLDTKVETIGVRILDRTVHFPPIADGSHGKFRGVTACAQVDKSLIAAEIVDAIRDGDPFGVGWKVMVEHRCGLLSPAASGLMKRSDQFATLGINTEHRQSMGSVVLNLGADVAKLSITQARARCIFYHLLKAFQVFAKRVVDVRVAELIMRI